MFRLLKGRNCAAVLFGSAILAFGLYNVHSFSGVTEGGVLGLTLLLDYWLDISPGISGFVLNLLCYLLGWKLLGREFIGYSIIAALGFSGAYTICEQFPPLWPEIEQMPLAASIIGALFVGVSVGICVRAGGAPGGDDALAMSISHLTGIKIQQVYLISDLLVLGLSLSYIPVRRMVFSLLSVVLSGQIVGVVQALDFRKLKRKIG